MGGLFKKMIDRAAQAANEQTVRLPITAAMLQYLFEKKSIAGVEKLEVGIVDGAVSIQGKAEKMLLSVPFQISLKPQRAEGRVLHFEVAAFTPANLEVVKKKVLDQPPLVSYAQGVVALDLNGLEAVKKVPLGSIKSIDIKDDKLWIGLGL
ncbi:hypothetical protein [Saccharibacillus qingshengii]|uniref:hypothetical protein n=1 Tax=Saccharibacillus qingshengii TaxID=1763540 RepID=UPI0015574E64|nr:hypothetical protein [Saccharibacillus qingshengii]